MARQTHNVQELLGSRNDYSAVNAARFSLQSADVVNKEEFQVSRGRRKEILVVNNTDSSAHTLIIETVPDPFGRKADVAYNLPPRSFHSFGPFETVGWQQPDGKLYFEADDSSVRFAVLAVR
jgi:hypothetical protein